MFVNATLDELAAEAEQIGFSHLQLHGDEGPAFCTEAARRTGCKVIKAAQVATAGDIRALERFHTDFHLLDAAAGAMRGGSGRTWEWGLLDERRSKVPLILSGGLGARQRRRGDRRRRTRGRSTARPAPSASPASRIPRRCGASSRSPPADGAAVV